MHPFFKDIDWDKIAEGKCGKPPFTPNLSSINADASHALNEALVDLDLGGNDKAADFAKILTDEDHAHFKKFEYNEKPYDRHLTNINKIQAMSANDRERVQMKAWKSGRKTSFLGKFQDGQGNVSAKWATRRSLTMIMEERLKLGDKIIKTPIPEEVAEELEVEPAKAQEQEE